MKRYLPLMILSLSLTAGISCAGNKKAENNEAKVVPAKAEWLAFDQAMEKAAADKKYVVVDFYTDWCKWCKVLDQKTYADPSVRAITDKQFVLAKVNPEKEGSYQYLDRTMTNADLAREFKVQGFPTTVYLDQDGAFCGSFAGFVPPEPYVRILNFIVSGEYRQQSLDSFISGL